MSEHDEQRPMTRRERRMREMGQSGPDAGVHEATEASPQDSVAAQASVDEAIEAISPYNEDGSLRTRAEMRALRAQLIAEQEAGQPEPEPEPEVEPEPEAEVEPEAEEEEASEPTEADASVPAEEFDAQAVPPTQPFSVGDLIEAESASATGADSDEPTFEELLSEENADVRQQLAAEEAEVAAAEAEVEAAEDASVGESEHAELVDAAIEPAEPSEDESQALGADATVPGEAADEDETPQSEKFEYSFPDIQPPEEWRSVFDDPVSRAGSGAAEASGSFDELIERAVAQEGSVGSSTSALIMPAHPDETGGLTGDLFVTGSIELPKSLAETGGRADIHDSLKFDPILPTETATELPTAPADVDGPKPMSAKSAVSARVPSDMPVVSAPAKETNKLPLILSMTGGGLLVGVAALGIWAWQSGMFG